VCICIQERGIKYVYVLNANLITQMAAPILPGRLPTTFEAGVGYRSLFDSHGREFVVYIMPQSIEDAQGRLYVIDGQILNWDPEKELPVKSVKLTPAQVIHNGGDPTQNYWEFHRIRQFIQADSSGGTSDPRVAAAQRPDESGGTGATGSGVPHMKRGEFWHAGQNRR